MANLQRVRRAGRVSAFNAGAVTVASQGRVPVRGAAPVLRAPFGLGVRFPERGCTMAARRNKMMGTSLCFLLYVAVLNCEPLAQEYLPALQTVPTAHWLQVTGIGIKVGSGRGMECDPTRKGPICSVYPGGIALPYPVKTRTIQHEVGHIIAQQHDGRLYRQWARAVWPGGVLSGRPQSTYTRRLWRERKSAPIDFSAPLYSHEWRVVREDFAESYRRYLAGGIQALDAPRAAFMTTVVDGWR